MNELFLELELEFNVSNNKKYKVKTIINSAIYTKEIEEHLPGLYFLIFWKDYIEEKSIWEPFFAVMHLQKIISTFYKDHQDKPTVTFLSLNSASSMTKPSVKPSTK